MASFKENPALMSWITVCVVLFLAGAGAAYYFMGEAAAAERTVESELRDLESLATAELAPREETLAQARQNEKVLQQQFADMISELRRGRGDDESIYDALPATSQDLYFDIQQLQRDLLALAQQKNIELADANEWFGFELVSQRGQGPAPSAMRPVYLQMVIIEELVSMLFNVKDKELKDYESPDVLRLENVLRTPVPGAFNRASADSGRRGRRGDSNPGVAMGLFQVPPNVTAEVPGIVDTLGFRIIFEARTKTLRLFLEELAQSELPLVVRSVEVETPTVDRRQQQQQNDAFVVEDDGGVSQNQEIVSNIPSKFTVTIEYIQIEESEEIAEEVVAEQ